MLGLGAGAVVGGGLADRFASRRILLFASIELTTDRNLITEYRYGR